MDARNPLRFRCEDLEDYVRDVEGPEGEKGTGKGIRRSLLLINKADLLTSYQRYVQRLFGSSKSLIILGSRLWADHFDEQGIQYAFFSAANAAALQQARRDALAQEQQGNAVPQGDHNDIADEDDDIKESSLSDRNHPETESDSDEESDSEDYFSADDEPEEEQDPRARVLTVLELEDLFMRMAPDLSGEQSVISDIRIFSRCHIAFTDSNGKLPQKLQVGLVGYPNVGKSSTINSLLGEKKVSVSSTPGKTKHFQTIHLSDSIVLCDCPGLVFPQFATTKADLVCDGVLPIDQMKEYTGPTTLVVKRIPKTVLEATYGLSIKVRSKEEGGDEQVTAESFLISYASAF